MLTYHETFGSYLYGTPIQASFDLLGTIMGRIKSYHRSMKNVIKEKTFQMRRVENLQTVRV